MALFGGSEVPGAPRWWDYAFGLLGGYAPSAVNDVFAQRAAQRAAAQQQAGMRSYIYNDAFGSNFGGGMAPYQGSTAATEALMQRQAQAAPIGAMGGGMGVPTTGGARTNSTAYTGDDGNLLYRADGSPRSYLELQNDRRFIALQSDPNAAGILKAWSDAAKERKPSYVFQNDQFFNTNSDDPSLTGRRVGTSVNENGIYTTVDPLTGQPIMRSVDGYAAAQAAAAGQKQRATSDATNASSLQYGPQIKRAEAYAQIDPQIALRQQQLEQDATLGAYAAGQKAKAETEAKAPYDIQTIQGMNGPITATRQQLLDQARAGGPMSGRSDSTLNAIRSANEASNDEISALNRTNGIIQQNLDRLGPGGLNLNIPENLIHRGQLALGIQDKQASNYNSFMGDMNLLRDQTLAMQKGTQTEGDANRAMTQLFQAMATNNEQAVRQRLQEIKELNEKAIASRQAAIRQRNEGYVVQAGPQRK